MYVFLFFNFLEQKSMLVNSVDISSLMQKTKSHFVTHSFPESCHGRHDLIMSYTGGIDLFIKKTLTTILLSNYAEIFEPLQFLIS